MWDKTGAEVKSIWTWGKCIKPTQIGPGQELNQGSYNCCSVGHLVTMTLQQEVCIWMQWSCCRVIHQWVSFDLLITQLLAAVCYYNYYKVGEALKILSVWVRWLVNSIVIIMLWSLLLVSDNINSQITSCLMFREGQAHN